MKSRRWRVAGIIASLVVAGVACGGGGPARPADHDEPAGGKAAAPEQTQPAPPDDQTHAAPLPLETVTIYFPSASTDGLVGETRGILHTSIPGDRAKQILSDLLAGPSDQSAVSLAPAGTRLKQVYVLENGIAYADFSEELRSGIEGGSDAEILTVYSIVNSLALNVPEIERVGILVEGRPCETLNGHLDLRRPLKPDRTLATDTRPEAPTEPGKTVVRNDEPSPRRRA